MTKINLSPTLFKGERDEIRTVFVEQSCRLLPKLRVFLKSVPIYKEKFFLETTALAPIVVEILVKRQTNFSWPKRATKGSSFLVIEK
jgi:hypothetical protein